MTGSVLRRPIVSGLGTGLLLGVAFVTLRVQGPSWLLAALQVLVVLVPVGAIALVASWIAIRRGIARARPVALLVGIWVGFVVGFFVFGLTTCAFCLA